jgi:hypothetical protein
MKIRDITASIYNWNKRVDLKKSILLQYFSTCACTMTRWLRRLRIDHSLTARYLPLFRKFVALTHRSDAAFCRIADASDIHLSSHADILIHTTGLNRNKNSGWFKTGSVSGYRELYWNIIKQWNTKSHFFIWLKANKQRYCSALCLFSWL